VTQQDPVKLRRAMELLMELREAFSQAAKKTAAAA
jgi:flagellin-specific chaperone FliS